MSVAQKLRTASRMGFGILNAGAAIFFLYLEMQKADPHTTHVLLFAGWVAFGWAIVTPSIFFGNVDKIMARIPALSIGGKRNPKDEGP